MQTSEGKCECYFMRGLQLNWEFRKKLRIIGGKAGSSQFFFFFFKDERLWHNLSMLLSLSDSILHTTYPHNTDATVRALKRTSRVCVKSDKR